MTAAWSPYGLPEKCQWNWKTKEGPVQNYTYQRARDGNQGTRDTLAIGATSSVWPITTVFKY